VRRPHTLVRRLIGNYIRSERGGFLRNFSAIGELAEFFVPGEKPIIDPFRPCGQYVPPPRRDPEVAAPRAFNEAGLRQIGFGPMRAVGEQGLAAGGQQDGA
jgi:hypothetical protein